MKVTLKEIATIGAGQNAPQGDENYCNDGTPFVKAGNLQELIEGGDIKNIQKVSRKVVEEYRLKLFQKGTILFAKSGMSCMKGLVYVLPQDSYVVNHLACITPNQNLSEYLKFYFLFNKPNRLIKDSAYPSISLTDISNIEIEIEENEKREKIVNQLNNLRCSIKLMNNIIAKYDDLVKARFVEMFGDPVSNTHNLAKATLSDLGEFGRGVSKHRPRNDPKLLGGIYPLIQTGDITSSNLYIKSFNNTYSDLGLKQSKMWSKGTLCITIAANIANTAILEFDACFPDSIVGFKANNKTNNIFIHYWFSFFQRLLESQAPESAQKNINLKILSELKVIVPPIELQNQFADFVKQVDKSKFIQMNSTI